MARAIYKLLIPGLLMLWIQSHVEGLPVRVCEKDEFFISCYKDESIDVKWALYGRENGTDICQINKAVPCGDEAASLQKVREACQGKQQCRFDVTNEYFGGDPCLNVGKYLTVDYVCSATDYFNATASTSPQSLSTTQANWWLSVNSPLWYLIGIVGGVIFLVAVFTWSCNRCKCCYSCCINGNSSVRLLSVSAEIDLIDSFDNIVRPSEEMTTEEVNQLCEEPPTYAEALEMILTAEANTHRPPEYESAVAPPTAS